VVLLVPVEVLASSDSPALNSVEALALCGAPPLIGSQVSRGTPAGPVLVEVEVGVVVMGVEVVRGRGENSPEGGPARRAPSWLLGSGARVRVRWRRET